MGSEEPTNYLHAVIHIKFNRMWGHSHPCYFIHFELNKAITHVSNLLGVKDKGYRTLTNIGSDGGQEVPHFHYHIFAGEKIGKMVS